MLGLISCWSTNNHVSQQKFTFPEESNPMTIIVEHDPMTVYQYSWAGEGSEGVWKLISWQSKLCHNIW